MFPFNALYTIVFLTLIACTATNRPNRIVKKQIENAPESLVVFPFYDTSQFEVLDSAMGDLNLDPYPDKVIVLKDKHEHITTTSARPALLLIGKSDFTYSLRARNDSIVLCNDCGGIYGDPYVDVVIEKGQVRFEHYGGSGWRWTRNISFQYKRQKSRWYLKEDSGVSYHAGEPDNVKTLRNNEDKYGKQLFEDFNNAF
ncbi:MAG: hypothetical protein ACKVOK_09385 [Flavobacteriales bacterium]